MYKPIIVIHETISSKEETIKLIQANPNTVSYHVIISLSGEITYLIPSDEIAKAGSNASFNGESINNSVDEFAYHIALESPLDGIPDVTEHSGYTNSQYYSLAWLTAKTGVPLDRIVLHKDIDLSGSRQDPRSFDRVKFEKLWNNYPKTKEIFFGIGDE
jgi:N-acetyl-anhydromuramyl-L-alanine amidase AmpD